MCVQKKFEVYKEQENRLSKYCIQRSTLQSDDEHQLTNVLLQISINLFIFK